MLFAVFLSFDGVFFFLWVIPWHHPLLMPGSLLANPIGSIEALRKHSNIAPLPNRTLGPDTLPNKLECRTQVPR